MDIHSKLAKIAGEIGSINKTERNEQQGFNFRSIEQITGAVRPLFAAEGVSVMPRVLSREYSEVVSKSNTKGYRCIVEVEYTFTAGSDGSSAVASMIGEAADYGDKATSKAVQMAYKYALTQVLQVGSGDDPDGQSVDVGHYKESNPRPRSGGRKLTPTPQSSESHEDAPRTNGNGDSGAEVRRLKSELLAKANGDKPKAMMVWRNAVGFFGLEPDQDIPTDMIEALEAHLNGAGWATA